MKLTSKSLPFLLETATLRFSAGPCSTISRSASLSSVYGTSMRTPRSATTCGMNEKPNIDQGATAPSAIVFDGSGTSAAPSIARTTPVPEHVGQAPSELKASASAPGGEKAAPHTGHVRSSPAATSMVGSR